MNRRLHFVFCFLTLMVLSLSTAIGQGLPCGGQVNVSIGTNCTATITPATMHSSLANTMTVSIKLSDLGLSSEGTVLTGGATVGGAYEGTAITINLQNLTGAGMFGPFPVSVKDATGNSCWGNVMLEDKLPPVITPVADATVNCLAAVDAKGNPRITVTGTPIVVPSSCSAISDSSYTDTTTEQNCSAPGGIVKTIRRIFVYRNIKGIAVSDTQMITVTAVLASELRRPVPLVTIKCFQSDSPAALAAMTTAPNNAGSTADSIAYPYVVTGGVVSYLLDGVGVCNVVATKNDIPLNACAPNVNFASCTASQKISRTWTILDWCAGTTTTFQQIIKKVDDIKPVITVVAPTTPFSVNAWGCGTDIVLPTATVTDSCDAGAKVVAIEGPLGVVITEASGVWTVKNAPVGKHTFIYTASDCCGNTSTASILVTVLDLVAPVASAKEFITVSLTKGNSGNGVNDGFAKITPSMVDNGSYDNCTKVYMEIRRPAGSPACLNLGQAITGGFYNNNVTFNNSLNGLNQNVALLHKDDNTRDTDKGQIVEFCCADLGPDNEVILRVWDDANGNGIFGDTIMMPVVDGPAMVISDNYNETWCKVRVEDKTLPKITCPAPITTFCDRAEDLKYSFGVWTTQDTLTPSNLTASVTGVCSNYPIEYRDAGTFDICNTGTITRTYRVKGSAVLNGVTCSTTITVANAQTNPALEWPIDLHEWSKCTLTEADVLENTVRSNRADGTTIQCMATGSNTINSATTNGKTPNAAPLGESLRNKNRFNPNWKNPGCNVYGRKITIDEYTIGEGCRKWLVRFDWINWCTTTNPSAGCRTTVYKYDDQIAPTITSCPANVTAEITASCNVVVPINYAATDGAECPQNGYTWKFTLTGPLKVAGGDSTINRTMSGLEATPSFPALRPGMYNVLATITDPCGNVAECSTKITVYGKAPTPYCVSLSSAVMKNGLVELWARDYDKGSFTNCGVGTLLFTFNRAGQAEHPVPTKLNTRHFFRGFGVEVTGTAAAVAAEYNAGRCQLWDPALGVNTSAMQFGCEINSPLSAPINVEMRVWDLRQFEAGTTRGSDFCRVALTLINNLGASPCSTTNGLAVGGTIATTKGDGVSGVETRLAANLPEFPVVSQTTAGVFNFANIPAGVAFELSAKKDVDYLNGVNTLDLLAIQKHILSITKLDNAYKYVAADADNDQKIGVNDLVELRKLVLGITNDLPNNQSWRFVDAKQTFAEVSNPWPLNEVIAATASASANDFVAIKIGDVNTDAVVSATSASVGTRSANAVKLSVAEQKLSAGEVASIAVTAENFNAVYGTQFTAGLKGLELLSVESGAIKVDAEMVATPKAGVMTMAWMNAAGATVGANEVLFTLKVKATTNTSVSNALSVGSAVTTAAAFVGSDLAQADVTLEVRGSKGSAFELSQNEPNPFKAETNIKFNMPEAGKANFRVMDVTGKVLVNRTISAAKGENVITLKRADVAASGIVYYQIESGNFTATKKMVILE